MRVLDALIPLFESECALGLKVVNCSAINSLRNTSEVSISNVKASKSLGFRSLVIILT